MNTQMTYLNIGGVVAIGFHGNYMLVISHSGSGLYEIGSWDKVARDRCLNYPIDGSVTGFGPIDKRRVSVQELNYSTEELATATPDGQYLLHYSEGIITIRKSNQQVDAPEPASPQQ